MPELPEVETIARGLDKKLRNRKITGFWTDWPKYSVKKSIIGHQISHVGRRAKNVLIFFKDKHVLLVHQKMSGHLIVGKWQKASDNPDASVGAKWQNQKWLPIPFKGPFTEDENRFIRLIFFLDNGQMLALSDLRRFAKIRFGTEKEVLEHADLQKLGPEPLKKEFVFKKFEEIFKKFSDRRPKAKIKQILLDQNFISGIGNIYADEILWYTKIHPATPLAKIKPAQIKEIYSATRKILTKAIKLGGTSADDYRDSDGNKGRYFAVRYAYAREKMPCYRCRTPLQRIKIAARSSHFCPRCQKI
ncbi:MAG: bifunctional DNA-formamidopyrimidine glycosylase/DNA-(apurinic or apyrimidinic site) lyase [bacterium]|nr:bifunctional DNA-formamidopyrimidine glycosylase/DNA-(apurinic or apyrimidinic site) lyase [bacterium]